MAEVRPDLHDPDLLAVDGELSFATAPALLEQGAALLAGRGGRVRFDLGGVTRTDSAGLALLVEWRRIARAGIEFRNVPPPLLAIARVSGVDGILALERDA